MGTRKPSGWKPELDDEQAWYTYVVGAWEAWRKSGTGRREGSLREAFVGARTGMAAGWRSVGRRVFCRRTEEQRTETGDGNANGDDNPKMRDGKPSNRATEAEDG